MDLLINILLGIIGSLFAAEIWANAPQLGRWFIKHAVLQLPASARDRFNEEWLSHLDECPGALGKLRHSLGCYFHAFTVAGAVANPEERALAEQAAVKLMIKIVAKIWTLRFLRLVIRGNFNGIKMMSILLEFFMFQCYLHRKTYGATNAEMKGIVGRCVQNIRRNAETLTPEAVLDDFAQAIRDDIKRRRHSSV